MADLIKAMPGEALPVAEVTDRLATMWDAGPEAGAAEFRASQMNVVLHFGLDVSNAEARERFDTLIRFAQRYPSRIIVLCPTLSISDGSMEAKLYSQCFIGDSHREMCCCEALMLAYKSEDSGYLANQVSIWLEGDLPTYHWFCGVPTKRIKKYYDSLIKGVRRCIYDSSYEKEDLRALDWPDPDRVRDLANARLLPVRQAIGQFLSGYELSALCNGLQKVRVSHAAGLSGEGFHLVEWLKDCLSECGARAQAGEPCASFELLNRTEDGAPLMVEFIYEDRRHFKWTKFKEGNLGEIVAYLGKHNEKITTRVKPLAAEQSIAEALFF
jgi:hypothetical protein